MYVNRSLGGGGSQLVEYTFQTPGEEKGDMYRQKRLLRIGT